MDIEEKRRRRKNNLIERYKNRQHSKIKARFETKLPQWKKDLIKKEKEENEK